MNYAAYNSMINTFVRDTSRNTYAFSWDAYFDCSCPQVETWLATEDVCRDTSEGSRDLYFSFWTILSDIALRLLCINYLHATCQFLVNVVFLYSIQVVALFSYLIKITFLFTVPKTCPFFKIFEKNLKCY